MELTSNLLKTLLFVLNFLFALTGIIMIIIAALIIADVEYFSRFTEGQLCVAGIVLIILGIVIFGVALFGCCGVIRRSPRLLRIYGFLVLIIFLAEIALAIAFFIYKPELVSRLTNQLKNAIKDNDEKDMKVFDMVQRDFMCCGVDSPADWIEQSPTQLLRASCCVPEYIDSATSDCKNAAPLFKDKYYQEGCLNKLKDVLKMNIDLVSYIALGFALFQILVIAAAFLLASYFSKDAS